MNVLTKVFVVLMAVLSIVLASLIIPNVANQEKYHDRWQSAEVQAVAARAEAAAARGALNETRLDMLQEQDDLKKALEGERTLKRTIENQLSSVQGQLVTAEAKLSQAEANAANLSAALQTALAIQNQQTAELGKLRQDTVGQKQQIIELTAALNDTESGRASLERLHRLAQEQLVATQQELTDVKELWEKVPNDIRQQVAGGSAAEGGVVEPTVPIRGQVTDVRQLDADTTLVQLNIGSNAQVKERMRFLLHRGNEYLGTLVITNVDEQRAAGRIRTLAQGATIQPGDQAWTGPIQ